MINLKRTNDALDKIAAKFRILRRKAGLAQKTVSKATGLNIGEIETAKKNITLSSLERLCTYYGVTLDEFFEDIDI